MLILAGVFLFGQKLVESPAMPKDIIIDSVSTTTPLMNEDEELNIPATTTPDSFDDEDEQEIITSTTTIETDFELE